MTLTINVPDRLRKTVEAASGGKNTILYTAKGQPCHMVVVPKFTIESIDPAMGSGTHPAFIVGGVEKAELFIGKFLGLSQNAEMVSVPGVDPVNMINHDAAVALARANGAGWHVMTNVEYAAIALWCWKNGFQPRGNASNGRSSDVATEQGVRSDGLVITGAGQGSHGRTLTGSGPSGWRHDNTPFGIADLNGNVWEWSPGMRLNNGEVQIIADNNAALAAADLSAGSAEWKAVDGVTGALVAPGSANTVKYNTTGTADYTLVRNSGGSLEGVNNPGGNPVSAAAIAVLKRLGLFPVAASGLGSDGIWISVSGERVPCRGGSWNYGAAAGVFACSLGNARTDVYGTFGARPAFVL